MLAARLKRAIQRAPEAALAPLAKSAGPRCKAFQRVKRNDFQEQWLARRASADAAKNRPPARGPPPRGQGAGKVAAQ